MKRQIDPYLRASRMKPGKARDSLVRFSIHHIESRIADYERFFQWPALFDSMRKDAEQLRALLSPCTTVGHSK